jgi:hypothetical protein
LIEDPWFDWHNYEIAVGNLLSGQPLYDPGWTNGTPWLYSPLLAWLLVPVVPFGFAASVAIHGAALAALRDRWLIAAVAVSWPWWTDVTAGNLFGVVFVLGYLAIRGEKWAEYGYLAACLLMPRPLQFPLAAWLLWKRPPLRLPALALTAGTLGLLLLTGRGFEWGGFLATSAGPLYATPNYSYSPTQWFGISWLLISAPIAAFALWRGWVGLSGLIVSPYLIPSYFLVFFWDLFGRRPGRRELHQPASSVARTTAIT